MINKRIFQIICVLLVSGGIFSSCYYDNDLTLYGTSGCDTTSVVYTDIADILDASCYRCHNNANAGSDGGDIFLEGHDNLIQHVVPGDAEASLLYGAVAWLPGYSQMPKGGSQLSDCELIKIRKWINDGAINN